MTWLSSFLRGGSLCIGLIKSIFSCLILIKGVYYLFWPFPLSHTVKHCPAKSAASVEFTLKRMIRKLLAWGRSVCLKGLCVCALETRFVRVCVCMCWACTFAKHLVISFHFPVHFYLNQTAAQWTLPALLSPLPSSSGLIMILNSDIIDRFFKIYITNHNQWCVMRMKTCMVVFSWYSVHTSKTWWYSVEKGNDKSSSYSSSYCISTLYVTRRGKISLYHVGGSWLQGFTLWDSLDWTVDCEIIDLEVRLSLINWSRILHDFPGILGYLKLTNED